VDKLGIEPFARRLVALLNEAARASNEVPGTTWCRAVPPLGLEVQIQARSDDRPCFRKQPPLKGVVEDPLPARLGLP
jgi:hypothetical protein